MAKQKIIKVKVVDWYDGPKNKIRHGIDLQITDGTWAHASENGKPLFFDDKKDAIAKRKEILIENGLVK